MGTTIIEGLDADRITCGKSFELYSLLAFFKNDKGKHAIQLTDGGRPTQLGIGVSDYLTVTTRDAFLIPAVFLLQIRVERVVVVDLSIGS